MATTDDYAKWIVDNQDKQGTEEFNTVVQAYEMSKQQDLAPKEIGAKEALQALAPAATSSQIQMVPQAAVPPPGVTGPGFAIKPEFAPTGINPQAVKQGLTPMADAYAKTLGLYGSKPVTGIADVAAVAMGLPPPVASYQAWQGAKGLPGAISATTSEIGKMTSSGEAIPGSPRTTTMDPYYKLRDAVRKAGAPEIYKDLMASEWKKDANGKPLPGTGGNNAVIKNLENDAKFQKLLKNSPEVAQAFENFRGAVPSAGQQAMKIIGPLARGAARVLGPVGMAADVYQAQEFAKESQLGERLAQGQGGTAQQAFRNQNVPYGPDFVNSMTPDQAQAILESNNERDITAFGGRDKLNELIRLKAAERVLGPIAPQGM